jgi:hypothetical protein
LIRQGITIRSTEVNIEVYRSLDSALITKSSTSKEVMDVLLLGDVEAIRGRRKLNPKKVAKRTKISHKKLLMGTGFSKGNVLRIITSDDHSVNIEQSESLTTIRGVDKQRWIMCAR